MSLLTNLSCGAGDDFNNLNDDRDMCLYELRDALRLLDGGGARQALDDMAADMSKGQYPVLRYLRIYRHLCEVSENGKV